MVMSVKSILLFESLGLFVLRGPQRNSSAQPRLSLEKHLMELKHGNRNVCFTVVYSESEKLRWEKSINFKLLQMCVKECELELLMRQMPSNFKCTVLLWFSSGILKELPHSSPLKRTKLRPRSDMREIKPVIFAITLPMTLKVDFLVHFVFMLGSFQGSERYTCEWLKGTLSESLH